MLKILQARLQQCVNREFSDVQVGFRKSRGIRDPINNICWIIKKARKFQKNTCFCFTDYVKAFDCVDRDKLWNILKRGGNTRSPDLPPEKSVCRSRSKLEPDMEQQTGSKSGKKYNKAEYCHPAYLTYMKNTS